MNNLVRLAACLISVALMVSCSNRYVQDLDVYQGQTLKTWSYVKDFPFNIANMTKRVASIVIPAIFTESKNRPLIMGGDFNAPGVGMSIVVDVVSEMPEDDRVYRDYLQSGRLKFVGKQSHRIDFKSRRGVGVIFTPSSGEPVDKGALFYTAGKYNFQASFFFEPKSSTPIPLMMDVARCLIKSEETLQITLTRDSQPAFNGHQ
jgi:hypothetical protein